MKGLLTVQNDLHFIALCVHVQSTLRMLKQCLNDVLHTWKVSTERWNFCKIKPPATAPNTYFTRFMASCGNGWAVIAQPHPMRFKDVCAACSIVRVS